jgi:hypothetical protein
MNQEFKEIAIKCGIMFDPVKQDRIHFISTTTLQRFGESIVSECIAEVEDQQDGGREIDETTHSPDWNEAVECISAMIRHRFGIKKTNK